MKARLAILITLLVFGGLGADWWVDGIVEDPAVVDVSKADGPGDPPPTPQP